MRCALFRDAGMGRQKQCVSVKVYHGAEDLQIYPRSPFADRTCPVQSCVVKSGLSVKILHSNGLHLLFSICTQTLAEKMPWLGDCGADARTVIWQDDLCWLLPVISCAVAVQPKQKSVWLCLAVFWMAWNLSQHLLNSLLLWRDGLGRKILFLLEYYKTLSGFAK